MKKVLRIFFFAEQNVRYKPLRLAVLKKKSVIDGVSMMHRRCVWATKDCIEIETGSLQLRKCLNSSSFPTLMCLNG